MKRKKEETWGNNENDKLIRERYSGENHGIKNFFKNNNTKFFYI